MNTDQYADERSACDSFTRASHPVLRVQVAHVHDVHIGVTGEVPVIAMRPLKAVALSELLRLRQTGGRRGGDELGARQERRRGDEVICGVGQNLYSTSASRACPEDTVLPHLCICEWWDRVTID